MAIGAPKLSRANYGGRGVMENAAMLGARRNNPRYTNKGTTLFISLVRGRGLLRGQSGRLLPCNPSCAASSASSLCARGIALAIMDRVSLVLLFCLTTSRFHLVRTFPTTMHGPLLHDDLLLDLGR
eukprot:scaffold287_cov337-Pavlova_lutheri.AAC.79